MELEFGTDENGVRVAYDPASLHTVVAGQTRSGKSVTVYTILADVARVSWTKIVGIDPTGILLGPASDGKPNDFALGTSPKSLDHAVGLLQNLEDLMDQRIEKLMVLGVDQIPPSAYQDPRLGAIILVLEEYAGLLSAASKEQGNEIRRIVGRVLREGSKATIHALTILQRPEAVVLHDRAQYARQIVMAVENGDSVRMLLPSATPEQTEQLLAAEKGRGFLAEAARPMRFFRADFTPYETYVRVMREACVVKEPVFGGNASGTDARQLVGGDE